MAHQRAARHQQVGTCGIETLIHQEVLLLPAEVSINLLHVGVEVVADIYGCLVDGLQRFQERSLIVQRLAGIGNEDGRDAERIAHDECG